MSLLHPHSPGFIGAVTFPHNPSDERAWGGGAYYQTATGLTVDYETALRVSCIFQGVRLIGQTVGSMPIKVMRDMGEGRREELRDHQVRRLMMRRPNSWQTPKQFRETLTAWSILWGFGIAEIKPGSRGAFDELWPIQPEWVREEQVRSTGRLRYVINEPGQPTRTLVQDEVFRLSGFGLNRTCGESVLALAREAIGLWVAHEKFQSLYFGRGAKPSVWLSYPHKIDGPTYLRLKEEANTKYGGWGGHHMVAIVEDGPTIKEAGWNAKDSQTVESKNALVEEIARFLNLAPQFFMLVSEPTHSSAEVFNQNAIDYTFLPHAYAWEQSIARDLFFDGTEDDVFAKHIFDALLRGRTLERAQAYASFVMNGILSENECRVMEDKDPWPGLDEPRRSVNQDRGADPRGASEEEDGEEEARPARRRRARTSEDEEASSSAAKRLRMLAESNAARVVRRELVAIADQGAKHATDTKKWQEWVDDFYSRHEPVVADALQLPPLLSRRYIEPHRSALKTHGLAATERWETEAVQELVALALAA